MARVYIDTPWEQTSECTSFHYVKHCHTRWANLSLSPFCTTTKRNPWHIPSHTASTPSDASITRARSSISPYIPRVVIYDLFFPREEKDIVSALFASSSDVEPISRSCPLFGCAISHWKRFSRLPSSYSPCVSEHFRIACQFSSQICSV